MLGGEVLVVILWPRAYSGAHDRVIQRDKISVISDFVCTISSLGLLLFLLHDRLQSSCIILSHLYLGIDAFEICTRLSRLALELKVVQLFQFRGQMERQFMRIPRQLLNLSTVISNLGSASQHLAKVSLNEWHQCDLLHARRALVVFQP